MGFLKKPEDIDKINLPINQTDQTKHKLANETQQAFNNRLAMNYQIQSKSYKSLLAYTEGYTAIVQYYKKLSAYVDKQTSSITIPSHWSDIVGKAYDLIRNMTIKLESPISINPDEDTTETVITGAAVVYPGINPHVGDLFLMQLDQTVVFIVTNTTPLSYHNDTLYRIEFAFYSYLTDDILNTLQQVTINVYVFDLDLYFNSNNAILKSSNYTKLENIDTVITQCLDQLQINHYDKTLDSFIRWDVEIQDKIYDPLAIEFFNIINTFHNVSSVAQLLVFYVTDTFKNTIWYRLLGNVTNVTNQYEIIGLSTSWQFDVMISSLINTKVLLCVESQKTFLQSSYVKSIITERIITDETVLDHYMFTNDFYLAVNGNSYVEANLTEFEILLLQIINNQMETASPTIEQKLLATKITIDKGFLSNLYFYILTIFILKKYKQYLLDKV